MAMAAFVTTPWRPAWPGLVRNHIVPVVASPATPSASSTMSAAARRSATPWLLLGAALTFAVSRSGRKIRVRNAVLRAATLIYGYHHVPKALRAGVALAAKKKKGQKQKYKMVRNEKGMFVRVKVDADEKAATVAPKAPAAAKAGAASGAQEALPVGLVAGLVQGTKPEKAGQSSSASPSSPTAELDERMGGEEFPKKIPVEGGVPIHIYTDDYDINTLTQLQNLARSRMPVAYVSAMPDVHLGKGATIGSVFASKDYICPNAVGVDIGCGMCCVPVAGLRKNDLSTKQLEGIQARLQDAIPVGFASHDRASAEMKSTMERLIEKHNPTKYLRKAMLAKHAKQLGTLGGGNHFIELVYDETDQVWMLLHSGSRHIGNMTAQHYDELAGKQCGRGKEDLAYLAIGSKEGQEYIRDMQFCQAYAFENRRFMMQAFEDSVKAETKKGAVWNEIVNIHHNYCEQQMCKYRDEETGEWKEEMLWVTRKGATSARDGQLGIIPGSMGTGSYIVCGKGEPDSWASCSHGAGRAMSRKKAFRELNQESFEEHMRERGIVWDRRYASKVKDEAPMAYKDLTTVMRNQQSLVEVVHHLQPLLNMKGF